MLYVEISLSSNTLKYPQIRFYAIKIYIRRRPRLCQRQYEYIQRGGT